MPLQSGQATEQVGGTQIKDTDHQGQGQQLHPLAAISGSL